MSGRGGEAGGGGEGGAGEGGACRKSLWEWSILVVLVLESLGYILFNHTVDTKEV